MSGWVLEAPGFIEAERWVDTQDVSVVVTASGTINTKGVWTEIHASTSFDVTFMDVGLFNSFSSGIATDMLLDIGVGGSGSEVVVIPNILAGYKDSLTNSGTTAFPIFIPAGSRISARCQSVIISDTIKVSVKLLGSPNSFNRDKARYGNYVTYGADTANSRGTELPTASSHNKGAWTEVTASTTEPHSVLAVSIAGHDDSSLGNLRVLIDVGFGASSSEQILIPDLRATQSASEKFAFTDWQLGMFALDRVIPVGTRLIARAQIHITQVGETVGICLHGAT